MVSSSALGTINDHRSCLSEPAIFRLAVTTDAPLRFETLGGARVLRAGRLLDSGTARPRELMLAILARRGLPISHLEVCDALWPDAEGDAARRAFDTTLHRLRHWLEVPNAISLSQGQLSLDFQHCTLDVRELERILDARNTEPASAGVDALTTHYRGRFLPELGLWPDAARYRDRLHDRVLCYLERAGAALERSQHFAEARELYRSALRIDDEQERFYQGLMRCAGECDRPAEVMSTLRRCVGVLRERLGSRASSETLALASRYGASPRMPSPLMACPGPPRAVQAASNPSVINARSFIET